MTEIKEIEDRLKDVLRRVMKESAPSEIDANVALVKEGLSLDSVALLEFVVSIEHEFGIVLDDELLTVEHFGSLGALALLVQKQLGTTSGVSQTPV